MCEAQRKQTWTKQRSSPLSPLPPHPGSQSSAGEGPVSNCVCERVQVPGQKSVQGRWGTNGAQAFVPREVKPAPDLEVMEMLAMWAQEGTGGSPGRRDSGMWSSCPSAEVAGYWDQRACRAVSCLFRERLACRFTSFCFPSSPLTDEKWISRGRDLTGFFTF